MSYVYCGFCGNRGHNKLGCPSRKKIAQEQPDHYIARQIAREKCDRAIITASRQCSYCRQKGHNRRGCLTRKTDIIKANQCQIKFVSDFFSHCSQLGLLPGALIMQSCKERRTVMYVEHFHWSSITFLLRDCGLDYHGRLPWGIAAKTVLETRVVSDKILHHREYSAHPFQPGQYSLLRMDQLAPLFDGVFQQPTDGRISPYGDELGNLEILSPISESFLKIPESCPETNRELSEHFGLRLSVKDPKPRLALHNPAWKEVYPSEHLEACQAIVSV